MTGGLVTEGKTQYRNAAAHIPVYVKLPSGEVLGVLTANDSVLCDVLSTKNT